MGVLLDIFVAVYMKDGRIRLWFNTMTILSSLTIISKI